MAISLKATGAWATAVATDSTVTLVGTPAAGDRYFLWSTWKDFAITATVSGWTEITEFADGSVVTGNGTGSMKVGCWYRDWQFGDTNPLLDFSTTTGLLQSHVMQLWQKGAGEVWDTPTFVTAAWPSQIGPATQSASSASNVADGAVVMCLMGFRDDSATMTRTTTSLSASPALTWNGNYVESPATHLNSTVGNDLSGDLGHRFVTTGHASTTLSTETTLTAAETGAILWVVQGVTPIAWPVFASIGTRLAGGSVSTANFAVPSGVAVDDVIMVFMYVDHGASGAYTITGVPSGFTEAPNSLTAASMDQRVFWKRATGADTGTYDFTLSEAPTWRTGYAVRYTGCTTSGNPIDIDTSQGNTGSSSYPSLSITSTVDNCLIVWSGTNFDGDGSITTTPPSGYDVRANTNTDATLTIVDKGQAAVGSTGSLTASASSGTNPKTAWLGALKPPTVGSLPPPVFRPNYGALFQL